MFGESNKLLDCADRFRSSTALIVTFNNIHTRVRLSEDTKRQDRLKQEPECVRLSQRRRHGGNFRLGLGHFDNFVSLKYRRNRSFIRNYLIANCDDKRAIDLTTGTNEARPEQEWCNFSPEPTPFEEPTPPPTVTPTETPTEIPTETPLPTPTPI